MISSIELSAEYLGPLPYQKLLALASRDNTSLMVVARRLLLQALDNLEQYVSADVAARAEAYARLPPPRVDEVVSLLRCGPRTLQDLQSTFSKPRKLSKALGASLAMGLVEEHRKDGVLVYNIPEVTGSLADSKWADKVMALFSKQPELTVMDVVVQLSCSLATAQRALKRLVAQGLLQVERRARKDHYKKPGPPRMVITLTQLQLRIKESLERTPRQTLANLSQRTSEPLPRVREAVRRLVRQGVLHGTPRRCGAMGKPALEYIVVTGSTKLPEDTFPCSRCMARVAKSMLKDVVQRGVRHLVCEDCERVVREDEQQTELDRVKADLGL